MACATISEAGTQALRDGAIALSNLACRLIVEDGLLDQAKAEFKKTTSK